MIRISDKQKEWIKKLLSQMTLEEKIGQMNQESVSIVGGFDVPFEELIEMVTDGRISQEAFEKIMSTAAQDYHEADIRAGRVGSLMVQNPRKCNELQKIAVEESRLGIPLLFGLDVIHGFRTVYPIAIAEACAFDMDLFERTARMAAKESRTQGVNWHFAPMLDVARDARWGRVSEGPGEDPYLVSCFARAKVRGLQNDTSSPENYVAACLKHFVAYGACEAGRDYNTVSMAHSMLCNNYLPPFAAAVEEGAATVMAAFHDLNGVPCTVNAGILRTMLKENYGFDGFVVSDANAIRECVTHGIAADEEAAGQTAVKAGLDMDMGTQIYKKHLKQAVADGRLSEKLIDEAVERILTVKMWLGLFEHPYVEERSMDRYEVLPREHLALAREAGCKSAVLLKNEGHLLPLHKKTKISLVGSLADKKEEVAGAWAISYRTNDCVSIKEGFENAGANVRYFPCGGPDTELEEEEIKKAASYGDVIVAVVGETAAMSGEAASKADLTLPGKQRELLEKLLATGKPVAVLLMNGRPLALHWEAEHIPAILECWQMGVEMGNAVADLVFGAVNPQGRLSVSFPQVTGQCPIYYNHPNTGRPGGKSKFTSRYLDVTEQPEFPFGFGLSYTEYQYHNLTVREEGDRLVVCVEVENTGTITGTETVQLYMRDVTASIVRPVKELKGFEKVTLEPGERREIILCLKKEEMGFYNNEGEYRLEDGVFTIYAGGNARDCLKQDLYITF